MIVVENLVKQYGTFCAVNDISFHIKRGEIFGFLGVNGAGKTTTLRILAGVLRQTSGKVTMGGHDIRTDSIAAKRITGYIPDRPHLYSKLTGREFLQFCADLYSVESKLAQARTDQLLQDYALTDWQHELIESYSHGMKQRLATCAALVHQPSILIVDEPMVGLDPHGAKLLKTSLRRYASEGMTILLSTHSLNVAEEVADRMAIVHQGSILMLGTLKEIKDGSGCPDERLENVFIQLTSPDWQDAVP